MKTLNIILTLILFITSIIKSAYAIPPPEFFIAFFNMMLQFLGLVFAIFLGWLYSFFKFFKFHKKRILILTLSIILFLIIIIVGISYYNFKVQESEQEWNSQIQNEISSSIQETLMLMENLTPEEKKLWSSHEQISNLVIEEVTFKNPQLDKQIISNDFIENIGTYEDLNILILDIRDNISFQRGKFKDSLHIKLADLVSGGWENLSLEEYDYVFLVCYAGTSGYLATEFLTSKGFNNIYYFKNGLLEFTQHQLFRELYEGEFVLSFPANQNSFLTLQEFNTLQNNDEIVLLDIRPITKFINEPISQNAHYFFYEAMTTKQVDIFFSQFEPNTQFILYCDSGLTCWLTGVIFYELQNRDFQYRGRFTTNEELLLTYRNGQSISNENYQRVIQSLNNNGRIK
ncbi:MAG: rhodanese-like domain-containing protein [Nanoarchaeota archaeon]|nr:rhodanese-like domain-containing protein [Nanoarchaeota archaeon]